MGSAIRNPRIQPGFGSANADSMIEGRTMVIGEPVAVLTDQRLLAERLGVRVGVGPPERLGSGLAGFDHSDAAPSPRAGARPARPVGGCRPRRSRHGRLAGRRPGARAGGTRRRGHRVDDGPPPTSARQSTSTWNRSRPTSLLASFALMGAGHIGGRDRDQVLGAGTALGWPPARVACTMAAATRDGPSRLTSTAASSGASKLTVAAECTTTSHSDSARQPLVVEPQPVGAHVAGHGGHPGRHLLGERGAELVPEAVEAVVAQHLALDPLGGGCPPTGSHEQHHPAVGNGAEEPLDQRRPQEAGGAGHEEAPSGQGVTHRGHRICLPYGK